MEIDRQTKIKDIELDVYPECPKEYLHQGGTLGIICDRNGFEYIVTPPCLKSILYLYDMNIRTVSCGAGGDNLLGISCDYDALSEQNRIIVDEYLRRKGYEIGEPVPNRIETRWFRINAVIDFEEDTIETAEEKLYNEVLSLGLVKQDVLYGTMQKEEAIEDMMERYSIRTMHWNGNEFESIVQCQIDRDEAIEYLKESGRIFVDDVVWASEELYQKHLEYIKEQRVCEERILTK